MGDLVSLVDQGIISSSVGREVLTELVAQGGEPIEIVSRRDLEQVSSEAALAPVIERVLADHPSEAERFRAGERRLLGFFVGQVMRATDGKADPIIAKSMLQDHTIEPERGEQ